jgi:hypothetical protein
MDGLRLGERGLRGRSAHNIFVGKRKKKRQLRRVFFLVEKGPAAETTDAPQP